MICPSFTFFATAGTIHNVGAKPVFVDIDPHTLHSLYRDLFAPVASAVEGRQKILVVADGGLVSHFTGPEDGGAMAGLA